MCVVSNVGDYFGDRFPARYPWYDPGSGYPMIQPTRAEFDALKKEVEELKKLLLAAKEFDKNTNQPDCEHEDKIKFIKSVADFVGINLDEVFKK